LLEKSFTGSKEKRVFYRLHQEKPQKPNWEYSRVGIIDGEMVAHVGIWPFEMQLVNGVALKCGGIRDVCTDPAYRKQRLGHLMLDDVTRFMENKGIELSVLYAGPRHFYEEKGWHGAVPASKFLVDLSKIDDAENSTIVLEEMTSYDEQLVDEMCKIRKQSNDDLFVVLRDDLYFHRLVQTDFDFPEEGWTPYIVRDINSGVCVGYLLGSIETPGTMIIAEARVSADDDDAVYLAIFNALKTTLGCTTMEIQLSFNYDICKAAAKLARIQDHTIPMSGVMIKFVSLKNFFTKFVEAINHQISSGKRGEIKDDFSERTIIKLVVHPGNDQENEGQVFAIAVDPSLDNGNIVKILPDSSLQVESINATVSISEEMLVTYLFAPMLPAAEAMEDGLIHVDGIDPACIDALFKGFTWDKEHRDYF
jgi:predicted N-acetyltransferase YhbS